MHQPRCSDCGWRGTPTTEARAAFSARQHKCERERWRQAMAARVAAREAVDGPKRPCKHKIARHQHGTHAAYVLDKCRCKPCRKGNRAYENNRQKQRAYGIQSYVPADRAREHLEELGKVGIGLKQVARITTVSHGSLSKIMYSIKGKPQSKRIRAETEAAILAVKPVLENMGSKVSVDALGSHRRVQALVAMGWSQSQVASRLGWDRGNWWAFMQRPQCGAEMALKVKALYEELRDQAPPENTWHEKSAATRARNIAKQRGWLPPECWLDDEIDRPDVDPEPMGLILDEVAIERRLAGENVHLTKAELILACHLAHDRKIEHANKVLGVSGSTYSNYLKRERPHEDAGRPAERPGLPSGDTGDGQEVRPDPQALHRAGQEGLATAS